MEASANEPAIKILKSSPSGPIPNFFVSLSSAFTQTPLVRPNKPSLLLLPPASDSVKLIQDLHRSLVSVTEKFSGFFHSLASRNPLFQEAVRLSSEFRCLCDEVDSLFLLMQIDIVISLSNLQTTFSHCYVLKLLRIFFGSTLHYV